MESCIDQYNLYEKHETDDLPPGFRFHPTDEELITYYLFNRAIIHSNFTCRAIAEADLNKCEPWHLPGKAKMGEREWYFFTLRDRKYPTGLRTNRATEAGYWKATGKDQEVYSTKSCSVVGMKKTLVFYRGRAPKGEKTNWIMHEYRLEGKLAYHYPSTNNSEDEWVICRVFQKPGSAAGGGRKRPSSATNTNISDVSSSSAAASTDGDTTSKKHVPCFSSYNFNSLSELPPPPSPLSRLILDPPPQPPPSDTRFGKHGGGLSVFPGLRSFEENLHPPLFFSSPPVHGGADQSYGSLDQWAAPLENRQMWPSELDYVWSH